MTAGNRAARTKLPLAQAGLSIDVFGLALSEGRFDTSGKAFYNQDP